MALAMEFKSGNTTIRIMNDCCSAPNQAEIDASIKEKICSDALVAIQAHPEKYRAWEAEMERNAKHEDQKGNNRRKRAAG